MKASDLMIGDWVSLYDSPIKINIDDLGVIDRDETYDKGTHCKPIPLTSEILKKNGFDHECNVGFVYEDYSTSNKIIVDMWDNTLKVIHNYNTVYCRTYYRFIGVHEFQHALKICGIEKEIIL